MYVKYHYIDEVMVNSFFVLFINISIDCENNIINLCVNSLLKIQDYPFMFILFPFRLSLLQSFYDKLDINWGFDIFFLDIR